MERGKNSNTAVGFPGGACGKEPACQCRRPSEREVRSLYQENPLEKEMATHSSILAWRIPWTEEPGRIQSMGLKKSQTRLKWRSTYAVEKSEMYHFSQVIKVNIGSHKSYPLWSSSPKPELIVKKTNLDKPKLRDSAQNSWPVLLKTVKVIKSRKMWDIVTAKGSPREMRGLNVCAILDGILGQKQDTGEKLIKSE